MMNVLLIILLLAIISKSVRKALFSCLVMAIILSVIGYLAISALFKGLDKIYHKNQKHESFKISSIFRGNNILQSGTSMSFPS